MPPSTVDVSIVRWYVFSSVCPFADVFVSMITLESIEISS